MNYSIRKLSKTNRIETRILLVARAGRLIRIRVRVRVRVRVMVMVRVRVRVRGM